LHSVVYDMIAKVLNTFSYTSTVPSILTTTPVLITEDPTKQMDEKTLTHVSQLKMQMLRTSVKNLVVSIFKDGKLTKLIVNAQRINDFEVEMPKGVRLGYMGHLTYISDEVCKLFEKCSPELDDVLHGICF
jgi:hypothetical protein